MWFKKLYSNAELQAHSVSEKTLYVFIRNHVESFKCDMSHVMEKPVYVNMSHWLVGSTDPAGACAVFGYHRRRGTGFFQDRAHIFSVYGVILYKCCL